MVVELSYLDNTIMCLSKHQGSAARILSTSSLASKEKRIKWSSINFSLKPAFALHKGLKVLAIESRFMGRFVRKRATMDDSVVAWLDFRTRPENSFLDR